MSTTWDDDRSCSVARASSPRNVGEVLTSQAPPPRRPIRRSGIRRRRRRATKARQAVGFSTYFSKLGSKVDIKTILIPGKTLEQWTRRFGEDTQGIVPFTIIQDMQRVRCDRFSTVMTKVTKRTLIGPEMGISVKTTDDDTEGITIEMGRMSMKRMNQRIRDSKISGSGNPGIPT